MEIAEGQKQVTIQQLTTLKKNSSIPAASPSISLGA